MWLERALGSVGMGLRVPQVGVPRLVTEFVVLGEESHVGLIATAFDANAIPNAANPSLQSVLDISETTTPQVYIMLTQYDGGGLFVKHSSPPRNPQADMEPGFLSGVLPYLDDKMIELGKEMGRRMDAAFMPTIDPVPTCHCCSICIRFAWRGS
ncbi:hypothetical protein Micbo1qcDRAFT_180866 [Microdochium bolleyi]|uniref:Uncharacterized protein n=1 Tax=Microdochium bolleyi TaxID=196109 RepID=A0A136IK75_9PEZI|nr:hypothetical protein Micbo1qcDRAFT_180866 [Microdochium bolleyi]